MPCANFEARSLCRAFLLARFDEAQAGRWSTLQFLIERDPDLGGGTHTELVLRSCRRGGERCTGISRPGRGSGRFRHDEPRMPVYVLIRGRKSIKCNFQLLDVQQDSFIKRYPSGVRPKPGRIIAPGFALKARPQVVALAAIHQEGRFGSDGSWRAAVRVLPVILPAQLAAEKIPVNFLLFTGSPILRSHGLCFRSGGDRIGCNFGQTNPSTASSAAADLGMEQLA